MSIFVITKILLLRGDVDSDPDSLTNVTNGSVELEGPLRFLGSIVSLTHQVVDQLVSEGVHLDFCDHLYHGWDHLLAVAHVELEGLAVLLGAVVVTRGLTPLLFAFVVLGNLEMLFGVAVVVLKHDLGVFVHLLMRLSNHESIFTLSTKDKELNGLLLASLSLTELGDLESALRQLALLSEDSLGTFSVIKVVQVQSDDVFPIIRALVSFLGLSVQLL